MEKTDLPVMFLSEKNRGGRPPKPVDDRRSIRITVCLRRDEYARIAASGLSPSEAIRAALVGLTIRPAAGLTPLEINTIARAVLSLRSGDIAAADTLLSALLK